jgi:hypothetical protein
MAARVVDSDVFAIIDTSLTNIDVFINTAHRMVDGYLSSKGLDEETLTDIERYLSAHVLSVQDMRTKSVGVDVLSESYQGQWGFGLKGTSYGQMAILLDTSGTLGKIAEKGYPKGAPSMSVLNYLP